MAFYPTYIQSQQGDFAMALAGFALSECSCLLAVFVFATISPRQFYHAADVCPEIPYMSSL